MRCKWVVYIKISTLIRVDRRFRETEREKVCPQIYTTTIVSLGIIICWAKALKSNKIHCNAHDSTDHKNGILIYLSKSRCLFSVDVNFAVKFSIKFLAFNPLNIFCRLKSSNSATVSVIHLIDLLLWVTNRNCHFHWIFRAWFSLISMLLRKWNWKWCFLFRIGFFQQKKIHSPSACAVFL